MIPEITFKEFANKLFEKKDTPNLLYISAISGQPNYHFFRYPYTWEEIIDYIDRWLYNIPIYKIDVEVYSAIEILKEYNGVPFSNTIQNIENFELINKLKEFIKLKANEVKGKAEAEQREAKEVKKVKQKEPRNNVFEDYLLCKDEEQKKHLMEKLEQLYKTAQPLDGFIIYRALEEAGHMQTKGHKRQQIYTAINERFGKEFTNQNYSGHFTSKTADHKEEIIKMIEFINKNL